MTTVLVAARQPQSQKRYRSLLEPAGVEAQFVADVDLLIQCVKSRPIDLVVFDVDDPRLPVRRWLDAARDDSDLGLVPVLWVGNRVLPDDLAALEQYRPGLHLPQLPDTKAILNAVELLTGGTRRSGESSPSGSQPVKTSTWTPAVDTIDDALSIFSDPTKEKKSSVVLHDCSVQAGPGKSQTPKPATARGVMDKDPGEDYDWFVTEMVKTETAPLKPHSDSASNGAGRAQGGKRETPSVELPELVAQGDPGVPGETFTAADHSSLETSNPTGGSSSSCSETSTEAEQDLVDRIAQEVACQLAIDLLRSLDQDTIRRAVETALAKPR